MYTIMKISKDMFNYLKETRKNKDEWERHLSYFWKDNIGEQYILLHGGEDGKSICLISVIIQLMNYMNIW